MSFIAILDANVLIPAAPRDTLLRAAERGLFRPAWSAQILDEVQRNLVNAVRVETSSVQKLIETLRIEFPDALVANYERLQDWLDVAPEDRHVLAAAIEVGAAAIVTENLADFPAIALRRQNVVALSIDDFLSLLFVLDPEGMTTTIVEQSKALVNPPVSVNQLLDHLARWAPSFAHAVRDYSGAQ